jgi:O-antigen ligase
MAMAALYTRGFARIAWLVLAPLTVAGLTVMLPGGAALATRAISLLNEGESGRELLFPATIEAIAVRPWVGWGLNSYQAVIGIFQPVSLSSYYDKAHNTYLELAFDLGIPAAAALIVAVIWIAGRCLVGFFQRNRDPELAGVGFLAAVLAGFHALFDFSLQIPAMACTFFAVLGIAWAQSWSGRRTDMSEPR